MNQNFLSLSRLLIGNAQGVPDTDIQYRRGVFAGIKMVLDQPLIAQNEIEREIAKGVKPDGKD